MALPRAPRRTASTRAVAIDIGFDAVRAVELERTSGRWRVLKRGSAPASSAWWDDLAGARDAIGQATRAALAAGGITGRHAVVGLPRRLVTVKQARLPHASADQVRGMVQFEAQQYIPFPLDEVVIDHQILSDEGDDLTTVLIVAARRVLLDGVLAAMERAGVEVMRISVSTLALAEHLGDGAVPVGVLRVAPGEMDFAVVADGRLLFDRAVSLNGAGDAGLPGEVARSMMAYQTSYRAQPVSRLSLIGEADAVERAQETLCAGAAVPVSRLTGGLLPAADPQGMPYATAIGLALEADGAGVGRVNLMPATHTARKQAARHRVRVLVGLAVLVPCVLVAALLAQQALAAQARASADAKRWNGRLKAVQAVYKQTRIDNDRAKKTWDTVATGIGRDRPAVDVFRIVSSALPKGGDIYLAQLAFERGGAVAIHGFARNERSATDLVVALQASGAFPEVRLGYLGDAQAEATGPGREAGGLTPRKAGEKMSFVVTCRFTRAEPAPVGRAGRGARQPGESAASASGGTQR